MSTKEKYDFVCSLGGNCMMASQLQQRWLRPFALPFDWVYYKNSTPIYQLIKNFKNDFQHFFMKENLIEVSQDEYSNKHNDRVQYKDISTEIYYYNHFNKKLDDDYEFEKVKQKMVRRIKRFLECIQKSNKILFLFSHSFYIENQPYIELLNSLQKMYPGKQIFIKVVQFATKEVNFLYNNSRLEIIRFERPANYYDDPRTNIEWEFLDYIECDFSKCKVKEKFKFLQIGRLKKGISFALLPTINSIFTIKLYIFGIRLIISLGKVKDFKNSK